MQFHDGEIAMQTRAGVRQQAARLGVAIHASIPRERRDFLAAQRFAVIGTIDARGRVWPTVVTGRPGFISAPDETTVKIGATPAAGDPLMENLAHPAHAALIVPDLAQRRRLRLNGRRKIVNGAIEIRTEQVYGNCARYIQERAPIGVREWPNGDARPAARGSRLSDEHRG